MTTSARVPFLFGTKVLQLGNGIAGSAAAALLASLGADVTRVSYGDAPERVGPRITTQAGPVAAVDLTLDRGKRVVEPPSDASTLTSEHDIVIVDRNRAVDPPRIENAVVVSVSPFGLDGPRSSQPGSELIAQAAGGLLATIGGPEATPVPAPGYVALKAAGAVAALAALHGLDRRNSANAAVHVDVSVQEAVVFTAALPECAHVLYSCPGRAGSGRYLAPSGTFESRDGLVRITAVENHQWQGLLGALGHPAWAVGLDERAARIEHADLINEHIAAWAAMYDKEVVRRAAAGQGGAVDAGEYRRGNPDLASIHLTQSGFADTAQWRRRVRPRTALARHIPAGAPTTGGRAGWPIFGSPS